MGVKPKTIRRQRQRRYNSVDLREMFGLEDEEMFKTVWYDQDHNELVVETYLDFDLKKGDESNK